MPLSQHNTPGLAASEPRGRPRGHLPCARVRGPVMHVLWVVMYVLWVVMHVLWVVMHVLPVNDTPAAVRAEAGGSGRAAFPRSTADTRPDCEQTEAPELPPSGWLSGPGRSGSCAGGAQVPSWSLPACLPRGGVGVGSHRLCARTRSSGVCLCSGTVWSRLFLCALSGCLAAGLENDIFLSD